MLDLLETDLEERNRLDVENGSDDMPLLRSSILASYIAQRSGRTTDVAMWIMKALFADGSTSSTSVFQEVWHREHKNKSLRAANKRKREKVNIDKGEYGGYLDDESVHSSQASEPPTPQKKGMRPSLGEEVLETAYVETIPLRQRLFSLVSYLCYGLPDTPPIDFSNLYQKFEQRVKELPLTVFSSFINISTSALRTDQQVEMLQGVLFLFMPAGALSPRKVDRARFEEGGISPIILERCFLPYPANTIEVEDHAKMSLLLENLVMVVWRHGERDERFSRGLGEAVRKGIEARWEKINKKKTRGRARVASEGDLGARTVLKASDLRLGWLVEAIEESAATAEDAMDEDDGL
ncbi:putative major facilitator superfamily transporter protein [Rosellinia necatrix]|uniref:Putative major facilitator superfamily transporter protein n=1 Tax=Rosellinia necatrix TaxID=77044 RepID=A0A1S8A8U9_ROSNE|nr:putative major facilitator superfamily transporter protein [Rosellinia necatrix]